MAAVIHGNQILIGLRNPAKVAQVPVEDVMLRFDVRGNRGHYEIAAVAAVAGDGEGPVGVLRGGNLPVRSYGRRF